MCFGIRILSQFHLATPIVYIQNLNCPKNAKNACADKIFGMIFHTMYDTCEMLNLSSQQEISYILLSVTNNIHLYHLPTSCWINHQNTDCTTSLLTCNQRRRHSFTSKRGDKNLARASVFRAFQILHGYNWSG